MLSFWEKDEFLNYYVVVIGGGIVGLSTAISLKEKHPSQKVLVLEQGVFPTGASTKNAGFACFGSLTEILSDLKCLPSEAVYDLVKLRWEGLNLLRNRLGDQAIDYKNWGGYELLKEEQMACLDKMDEVNELLYPLFSQKVYTDKTDHIQALGFPKQSIHGLIFNPLEAQIHTGKMMWQLNAHAKKLGIEVLTGASVISFEDNGKGCDVELENGITFKAHQLAICTNAFSKKLIPNVELNPGRGVVLITKPIKGLGLKGTFHYDEGYYYFRNYKDRIIFGGGRNLDLEGENTTDFEIRSLILEKLEQDLKEVIIPNYDFEIDHVWAGIMAFGQNKKPILKRHSTNVFLGLRLGGMGVAIGSKMGEELAALMSSPS
ncbi:NAD(P)/FAD-dependent oxidoreductase [Roseivirga sp.]|uniref:NAD(P)/FAD-dependent oxidoreductase n=1 Tax=Roseivirga sp. TaxID=1964215 RepID=UPI003B8B885D